LIITRGFWGKGDNLALLKRKASRDSTWEKGAVRTYQAFLVHKDTKIVDDQFEFPSKQAANTAIDLGTI
jgi:hypothetical protein